MARPLQAATLHSNWACCWPALGLNLACSCLFLAARSGSHLPSELTELRSGKHLPAEPPVLETAYQKNNCGSFLLLPQLPVLAAHCRQNRLSHLPPEPPVQEGACPTQNRPCRSHLSPEPPVLEATCLQNRPVWLPPTSLATRVTAHHGFRTITYEGLDVVVSLYVMRAPPQQSPSKVTIESVFCP
jgi:hypothetical protein